MLVFRYVCRVGVLSFISSLCTVSFGLCLYLPPPTPCLQWKKPGMEHLSLGSALIPLCSLLSSSLGARGGWPKRGSHFFKAYCVLFIQILLSITVSMLIPVEKPIFPSGYALRYVSCFVLRAHNSSFLCFSSTVTVILRKQGEWNGSLPGSWFTEVD